MRKAAKADCIVALETTRRTGSASHIAIPRMIVANAPDCSKATVRTSALDIEKLPPRQRLVIITDLAVGLWLLIGSVNMLCVYLL